MAKKCESCRFFEHGCRKDHCTKSMPEHPLSYEEVLPIDVAREICDREGDGIFVYFEPAAAQPITYEKNREVYEAGV